MKQREEMIGPLKAARFGVQRNLKGEIGKNRGAGSQLLNDFVRVGGSKSEETSGDDVEDQMR